MSSLYEQGQRSSPRDFEKKQDVRSEILAERRPFKCKQSVGGTFCNPDRCRDAALAAPLARGLACPRRRLNDLGVCLLVNSKKERTSETQCEPDGGRFSLSSISAGVEVCFLLPPTCSFVSIFTSSHLLGSAPQARDRTDMYVHTMYVCMYLGVQYLS